MTELGTESLHDFNCERRAGGDAESQLWQRWYRA